jgi:hypothetical protein
MILLKLGFEAGAATTVIAAIMQWVPPVTAVIGLVYWGAKLYLEVWPEIKRRIKLLWKNPPEI